MHAQLNLSINNCTRKTSNQLRCCLRRMKRHLKKTGSVPHCLLASVGSCIAASAARFLCPIRWPKGAVKPEQGRLLSTTCTRTCKVLSAVWGCALDVQSAHCLSLQRAKHGTTLQPKRTESETTCSSYCSISSFNIQTHGPGFILHNGLDCWLPTCERCAGSASTWRRVFNWMLGSLKGFGSGKIIYMATYRADEWAQCWKLTSFLALKWYTLFSN